MVWLFCLTPFILFSATTLAQPMPLSIDIGKSVTINAENLVFDTVAQTLTADGQVLFYSEKIELRADQVGGQLSDGQWLAFGDVSFKQDGVKVFAQQLALSIKGLELLLTDARVELVDTSDGAGHRSFIMEGVRIVRSEDGSWSVRDGMFTPCDCGEGEKASWSMTCSEAEIKPGEEAILSRPVFRIMDVPVFALPEARIPMSRRKTGFLAPGFSYSDRLGARLQEEFFWAIDDRSDSTIGLDAMHRRGVRPTLEFRAVSEDFAGEWAGFYLRDMQGDEKDVASDRFGLSLKHDWNILDNLRHRADVRFVSDAGVDSDFGRGWRSRTSDFLESSVSLFSQGEEVFLGVRAQFAQRMFDPVRDDGWLWEKGSNPAIQAAPSMLFRLPSYPVWDGRLLVDLATGADLFFIPEKADFANVLSKFPYAFELPAKQGAIGEAGRALRLSLRPKLIAPIHFGDWAELDLQAGVKHISHVLSDVSTDHRSEGYLDFAAEGSTKIYRIYSLDSGAKLKHEIKPRLTWIYLPYSYENEDVSESVYPETPLDDRIAPHRLSFGLDQRFVHRDAESGRLREFLKFGLSQGIFCESGSRDRFDGWLDDGIADLDLSLPHVEFDGSLEFRWSSMDLGAAGSRLHFGKMAGFTLSHGYRYLAAGLPRGSWLLQRRDDDSEEIHQMGGGVSWSYRKSLKLSYWVDYSLAAMSLIEQQWRLTYYSACRCWSAELSAYHRPGLPFPDVFLSIDLTRLVAGVD